MKLLYPALALTAALLVALATPASAEMVVGNVRVIKVTGSSAQHLGPTGKKTPLKEGEFLQQGSKILTGRDSTVSLVFENGASVQIEPSSQFSIDQFVQDPFNSDNLDYRTVDQAPTRSVTKLSISEGEMIFNVAKQKSGSTFNITTPVGVAGIRGTSGSAGSQGFGLATGSASFTPSGGAPTNIGAGQNFSPGSGLGPLPTNQQQNINSATQSMNSNTPPNTFNAAPPNITPQQHSALQAAAAQGGSELAAVAAQLASQNPSAAVDIAGAAAFMLPQAAPQIAQAVIAAVPSADPAAVQQAASQGSGQQQGQGNQPLNTGDQGTSTAGQQLPGTGSGTSGNPGQSNPRPTPIPTPTPPSQ